MTKSSEISVLLATYSRFGGPGTVQASLAQGMRSLGFSVNEIYKMESSLREKPFRNLGETIRAGIDEFVAKKPEFENPISLYRNWPEDNLLGAVQHNFAVLGWLPGLLSKMDYESLRNTPTVIRLPDQNVFTGVCHYSGACQGFESGCTDCPAVRSPLKSSVRNNLLQKRNAYERLEKKIFVAPSDWVASKARSSSILSQEKIEVIRNPIRLDFFSKDKLVPRSEKFTVLFVASQVFDPVKGYAQIAKDLDELAVDIDADIRVVGFANQAPSGLERTTFVGRLDAADLSVEYQKAWVTIVPSLSEASGNIVSESLAAGTPAIVRRVDGLAEVAGIVDPDLVVDSSEELFSKLRRLHLAKRVHGSSARRQIAEKSSPSSVASQYLNLLQSL